MDLKNSIVVLVCQVLLTFVYSVYLYGFIHVQPSNQKFYLVLLPMIVGCILVLTIVGYGTNNGPVDKQTLPQICDKVVVIPTKSDEDDAIKIRTRESARVTRPTTHDTDDEEEKTGSKVTFTRSGGETTRTESQGDQDDQSTEQRSDADISSDVMNMAAITAVLQRLGADVVGIRSTASRNQPTKV
ncbi:hypothetical protein PHMEG_00035045 [Phytophthora megakarya]|uniref:Uncharacterized protein n=1 Tax=Phytophthora megakarya TaxID=4795 RepID=A0A225UQ34_9STRA|nr:hypothetical protein PHMEG_00035045 [Phytophthora megakarya]